MISIEVCCHSLDFCECVYVFVFIVSAAEVLSTGSYVHWLSGSFVLSLCTEC